MKTRFNSNLCLIAAIGLLSVPTPLLAGGYGDTAVDDANVGRTAASGRTVYCEALGQDVPERLAARMDCDTATATPAVADDRIENPSSVVSFFERFRHKPSRNRDVVQEDNDRDARPQPDPSDPPVVVASDDTPPSPPTSSGGPVGKWERMADFGVNPDNFGDIDDDFREQVVDFIRENGGGADWSGFSPD